MFASQCEYLSNYTNNVIDKLVIKCEDEPTKINISFSVDF